ncbi:hypothetical protein Rsub_07527 [Raphidocelis subcapitata]|uniref:Uncharacterized protein n=1 Tax=Raphidocelis subcapitata TaxID=307507 RepID=A0A2V0P598_9CHLO|nr:hypothetical protein Rsub_07527 [Raphidocelis subcapitata]|eukprot:GBF95026.1 hypothetical protein Rsub_07527 [Raphidocelis subcapitata]
MRAHHIRSAGAAGRAPRQCARRSGAAPASGRARLACRCSTEGAAAPPPPAPSPPARLAPEQQAQWKACVQQLTSLGFGEEDSDKMVARAFGWATQAYWRKEKVEEAPDAARAAAALAVLREVGVAEADVPRVVKAFPELIGCGEDRLRGNVDHLRSAWKLDGPVLAAAVVRQPALLGYTIDCMGDCAGECNRCWARF